MRTFDRALRALQGGLLLSIGLVSGPAFSQSFFADSFEPQFDRPNPYEAARFLNQATFGATPASIASVQAGGVRSWVNAQFQLPQTLARPFLESLAVIENTADRDLTQVHRVQRWVDTAITAPDQLRQKVAYALGQMIVVSDQNDGLSDEPIMMAEWNDILVRNAFGNYRDLLRDATLSPMMGRYLSHLRNRKFELTPRCEDKLAPLNNDTNTNTPGLEYHSCSSNDATNNNTVAPTIAAYQLPSGGLIAPDENYAREVMQLFSIGLIERDADFSPIEVGGQTVPTYNQQTIVTLSRVMTGLGYACSGTRTVAGQSIPRTCSCVGAECAYFNSGNHFFSTPPRLTIGNRDDLTHPDNYEPMACYPRYHDTGRDRFGYQLPGALGTSPVGVTLVLGAGQSIPGGTPDAAKVIELGGAPMLTLTEVSPGLARAAGTLNCDATGLNTSGTLRPDQLTAAQRVECVNYCNNDFESAIDLLFLEPNTAVMVSRQLIQRLVSSNPSPEYIERVTRAFENNGAGVRGDMKAVVLAVLTDPEARRPVAQSAASSGKEREPLLRLLQLWRSFGATPGLPSANNAAAYAQGYRIWARFTGACGATTWPQCAYQQRPLGAPSVFNFYEPDYQQPGIITDQGLFSPEFQIINENSAILAANDLYAQICSGYGSNSDCNNAFVATAPTDRAYFPPTVLDALPGASCGTTCAPGNDAALIEEFNLRLFGGTMSGAIGDLNDAASASNTGMKGALFRLLRNALRYENITNPPAGSTGQDARRREILYTLHMISISPEYATQR